MARSSHDSDDSTDSEEELDSPKRIVQQTAQGENMDVDSTEGIFLISLFFSHNPILSDKRSVHKIIIHILQTKNLVVRTSNEYHSICFGGEIRKKYLSFLVEKST